MLQIATHNASTSAAQQVSLLALFTSLLRPSLLVMGCAIAPTLLALSPALRRAMWRAWWDGGRMGSAETCRHVDAMLRRASA